MSSQTIHGARHAIFGLVRMAAREHISKVSPKRWRVEAIDDWVKACVQIAKNKEDVVHIFRRVLDHVWFEPVPDPQQVIGRPTDNEGAHNHNGHLKGLHPRFGYHVCSTAPQVVFTFCRHKT